MKSFKVKINKPETQGTEVAFNRNYRTGATVRLEKQLQYPYLQIKLNPQISSKLKTKNRYRKIALLATNKTRKP